MNMPLDFATWAAFAAALTTGMSLLRDSYVDERQRVDQALIAIYTASNETRNYITELHQGQQPNMQREQQLAHLWELASIPLRHFDKDLARRCELKGNYWRDTAEWPPDLINEARIGLDRIFKEAQYLLRLR